MMGSGTGKSSKIAIRFPRHARTGENPVLGALDSRLRGNDGTQKQVIKNVLTIAQDLKGADYMDWGVITSSGVASRNCCLYS